MIRDQFSSPTSTGQRGFSLVELAISIAILTVIMGAMMQFMGMLQQRYTQQQRVSGASQTGKTVMDLLAMDIGQAGYQREIITSSAAAIPMGSTTAQLASVARIYPGRVLIVDTGMNQESVRVTAVDAATNTVTGMFAVNHLTPPVLVRVSDIPYPEGILLRKDDAAADFAVTSNGDRLRIFGDLWDDGSLRYIEYRFTAGVDPCTGTLVRSDSSAFATGQDPAVTVAERLCNVSATTPVFTYTTPCPAGDAFNYLVYDPATSCPPTGAFTYTTSVTVNLITQTERPVERGAGGVMRMTMRETFAPRNVLHAMRIAQDGLQNLLPTRPASVPVP